jgi:hypothetical protein
MGLLDAPAPAGTGLLDTPGDFGLTPQSAMGLLGAYLNWRNANAAATRNAWDQWYQLVQKPFDPNANITPEMMGAVAGFAAPIKAAGGALDMSEAARMARAQDLGYTVDAFHGTKGDISAFSPDRLGQSTDAPSAAQAYFFTDKPIVADTYAENAPNPRLTDAAQHSENRIGNLRAADDRAFEDSVRMQQLRDAGQISEQDFQKWWSDYVKNSRMNQSEQDALRLRVIDYTKRAKEEGANVLPVKLRLENPLVKDYSGTEYRDQSFNDLLNQARAAGHDGVIFKDVYDAWKMYGGDPYRSTVYAVFNPSQIRSRFAAFDPARIGSPDLLASAGGAGLLGYGLLGGDNR